MASKKKLRGRIKAWKDAYDVLAENLAAARKSFVELRAHMAAEYTAYEADLNASQAREAIAEEKLAALTDQATKFDAVVGERDKAHRELQAARVAAEALRQALYPMQYAKGGKVGPNPAGSDSLLVALDSSYVVPKSAFSPAAQGTYDSIMGLKNKSWKPQAYQSNDGLG